MPIGCLAALGEFHGHKEETSASTQTAGSEADSRSLGRRTPGVAFPDARGNLHEAAAKGAGRGGGAVRCQGQAEQTQTRSERNSEESRLQERSPSGDGRISPCLTAAHTLGILVARIPRAKSRRGPHCGCVA